MRKQYITTSLVVLVIGIGLTVAVINGIIFADDKKSNTQNEVITDADFEKIKENLKGQPGVDIRTEYGTFDYVEHPNEYPDEQIVILPDEDDKVGPETKLIEFNGHFYEKK
ncbi:hypothetical protein [Paenibacillus solani]|uniref:hypothetical protein n=1 Tax=Paenibacillus solani TaxID=1705565 RepID=UPI003D2D5C33